MSIRDFIRKLILKLPFMIRAPLIRRTIRFPTEIDKNLRFKIAETKDELSQAFEILHDSYVKEGLMTPDPNKLRITKYHSLPSTTTLIALEGDLVVGTLTLIRKSYFGLPLESIFEVGSLPQGSRVAEISSLAIRNNMWVQKGRILFPLLKFAFHYSTEFFGVTHFLIAVNPKWFEFYRSILLFTKLSKKTVKSYDFVNGAPAVGGILDLTQAYVNYKRIYGNKTKDRNIFHFFIKLERTNMEFPLRKTGVLNDPVLSPQIMNHFFVKNTNTFENLNDFEKNTLRELYNNSDYRVLIPKSNVTMIRRRQSVRFDTTLRGHLQLPNNQSLEVQIQDVALNGISGIIKLSTPPPPGLYKFNLDIGNETFCEMDGQILRITSDGQFAAFIKTPTSDWNNFVSELNCRQLFENNPALKKAG